MHKTFIIEGMSCAACSSAVERIMNRQEAVESASVNLTTKKLDLVYDDSLLSVEVITEKISKAGYEALEYIPLKKIVLPIGGMT